MVIVSSTKRSQDLATFRDLAEVLPATKIATIVALLPQIEGLRRQGHKTKACRTAMGITQREAARPIGVDQGTLARWERGEREPTGQFEVRAERFLTAAQSECTALTA